MSLHLTTQSRWGLALLCGALLVSTAWADRPEGAGQGKRPHMPEQRMHDDRPRARRGRPEKPVKVRTLNLGTNRPPETFMAHKSPKANARPAWRKREMVACRQVKRDSGPLVGLCPPTWCFTPYQLNYSGAWAHLQLATNMCLPPVTFC